MPAEAWLGKSSVQSCLSLQIKAVDCRSYGKSVSDFRIQLCNRFLTLCTKTFLTRVAGCPLLLKAISHQDETIDHVTMVSNNRSQNILPNPLPYSPLSRMTLRTGHRGLTPYFNCSVDHVTMTTWL